MNNRAYWAEQNAEQERRKNEPVIDYNRIAKTKSWAKDKEADISNILDDIWEA